MLLVFTFLSKKLNHNYNYLSNLFFEVKGTSIEQYFLSHKIEKIKELLVYYELNLTEIAWKLNFSSVSHLSNQFKKMTGFTPSQFKKLKLKRRISQQNLNESRSQRDFLFHQIFRKLIYL
jgi:AraC-like DNA-binding protein